MGNKRGFTLIELIIAVVAIGIVATLFINGAAALTNTSSSVSFGLNGMTEVRCIDGYRFVIGSEGNARQILDEFGKGAKCK
jgi:prepilin-type N-terminal cleavage/methylation domain-containing protein